MKPERRPELIGVLVLTAGALSALVGTFLPWVRSGATTRSSYEIFDLVDRLGFTPSGLVGTALRLWPLTPLLLVLAVVATWWATDRRSWQRGAAAVTLAAVAYAGGTATAIRFAPDSGLLRIGVGPTVTALGAVVMLIGVGLGFSRTRSGPSEAS